MYSTVERACAGYIFEADGTPLWIDAGGGTWRNLLQHVDHRLLAGVVLTHRHPDHTIDIFQAMHARLYGDEGPAPKIPLWAPSETVERVVVYGQDLEKTFDLRTVKDGDTISVGAAQLSFVRMAHPAETLGVRVEAPGATVAYSADTGPDADFGALASGADVFFCEATFQDSDDEWEGHLRASQAAEIAARVGVEKLVLTHLPAGRDLGLSVAEAQKHSGDSEVQLAADGLRVEVAH
jgi:ribonuclease BN (tRNA processing enzyme)